MTHMTSWPHPRDKRQNLNTRQDMPTRKLALKVKVDEPKTVDVVDMVPPGIEDKATITIEGESFECNIRDLKSEKELGRGAYGAVYRMKHLPTDKILAVKRIRATVDQNEQKRVLMDLNVCMKSLACPYTVHFYGALFGEGDVWICMELMDMSLHDLYKLVYDKLKIKIPEAVVGKMAESTLKALFFLKTELNVLHRDVKPSNILINKSGEIKLCDFGIAGELVNSFLATDIGCKPYLAPERINPVQSGAKYDQRSDVWSFGITISELALGRFPYPPWKNVFEQLKTVVEGDAPRIPPDSDFSEEFVDFIHKCLTKDVAQRPKFHMLVEEPYIKIIEKQEIDVRGWYHEVLEKKALMDQEQTHS